MYHRNHTRLTIFCAPFHHNNGMECSFLLLNLSRTAGLSDHLLLEPRFTGQSTELSTLGSGYLMTAVVNGQQFRGVLFAPGPGVTAPRPAAHHQIVTSSAVLPQHRSSLAHAAAIHARPGPHDMGFVLPDFVHCALPQLFPAQAVRA